jgi:murein DD-endopeptidase MepM/ murein hydrolase activator NlpD
MKRPVDIDNGGYRSFGYRLDGKYHNGHDYNCPLNSYVHSICPGKVIFSDIIDGFGGLNPRKPGGVTIIQHCDKNGYIFTALYGHIKLFRKAGEILQEGDIVGIIAEFTNDGMLLPHLHFAIHKGEELPPKPWGYVSTLGKWINPLDVLDRGQIEI